MEIDSPLFEDGGKKVGEDADPFWLESPEDTRGGGSVGKRGGGCGPMRGGDSASGGRRGVSGKDGNSVRGGGSGGGGGSGMMEKQRCLLSSSSSSVCSSVTSVASSTSAATRSRIAQFFAE